MSNSLRLPRYSEVFGRNQKRIFKIFGKVTNNSEYSSRITGRDNVWALHPNTNPYPHMICVDEKGNQAEYHQFNPYAGIRPCMEYSAMADRAETVHDFGDGLKLVKFGAYPKRKCTSEEIAALKTLMDNELASTSGGYYYRRSSSLGMTKTKDGESIVTFGSDPYFTSCYELDSEVVDKYGNYYANCNGTWYLVQPVLWLVDEIENYAITEEIISGGIPAGKCFDKNSTTKIRSEQLSIILFVDRVIETELRDTIISHIEFPEIDERLYLMLRNYAPVLKDLRNRMTPEETIQLEEKIREYQEKKDNYYQYNLVKRGK